MIDRATVDRIIDTAEIVDVVSDFVSLKRRGANYVGLCPFHNDRRPSFYVSPSKGICKCFSCGKGGTALNFIMEHEQMSYVEALRFLAKKYNIDIQERELSDEEKEQQSERESMLIINEFAMHFFEQQLHETQAGQEIGMSYFRERGFGDESIKKFHLGYSPEGRTSLFEVATKAGYNKKILFDVGLCIDDNRGGGYDRFRGRVIFPIFNVAGKVVAFGGRTLKNDPAKYVNSPESLIYNKRNELYGLFQAKREIAKHDKCVIVEGYADVISMHQAGFENVIASSGTALTEGHIVKIRRFTEHVTEMFDGDEAGVHAALRGVDMLLGQGLNVKVLLLPAPEDPDSFARSHSASQILQYIEDNETDFIKFKTAVLLKDSANDPIKKASAIADIIKSISVIPDSITRSIYAKECSNDLDIEEAVVMQEIKKNRRKLKDEEFKRQERERNRALHHNDAPQAVTTQAVDGVPSSSSSQPVASQEVFTTQVRNNKLQRHEAEVIRYIAKYGMCYLCETTYENNESRPTTVCEYIYMELLADNMSFSNETYRAIFDIAVAMVPDFYQALATFMASQEEKRQALLKEGYAQIAAEEMSDSATIEAKEKNLEKKVAMTSEEEMMNYRQTYLEKKLCNDIHDNIRRVSLELVSEKHHLSKIHTQFALVTSEYDRLCTLIPEAIFGWKNALVEDRILKLNDLLKKASGNEVIEILKEIQSLVQTRKTLAKLTGERVVNPIF